MRFTKSAKLKPSQQAAIQELAARCLADDPTCSPIWAEDDADTHYFMAWDNDQLVGALSLSLYEESAPALLISAAVDPMRRRQGIFTNLLKRAAAYAEDRYVFSEQFLPFSGYINHSCKSIMPVLEALHAYYVSKEFLLTLKQPAVHAAARAASDSKSIPDPSFRIQRCDDTDLLTSLQEACFDYSHVSASAYISLMLEEPDLESWVIYEKENAAGLFFLLHSEDAVYLMGFGIHPDYRRGGLSVRTLDAICSMLPTRINVLRLQVSDRNPVAHHLYLSYGFEKEDCICEYRFTLPVHESADTASH